MIAPGDATKFRVTCHAFQKRNAGYDRRHSEESSLKGNILLAKIGSHVTIL